MKVERTDSVSVFTQDMKRAKAFYAGTVCKMAFFKDPDGNALLLHRRFDA